MSRRYLTLAEAQGALAAGRSVEQWLGATTSALGPIVSYVGCSKTRDGSFLVTLYRKIDTGSDEFFDVYEFDSVDEVAPASSFTTSAAALEYAMRSLGANGARFLNAGVVQDEYSDHRHRAASRA